MIFKCVTLFFMVMAALAQPPADRKPASIEGTVLNAVTKQPLRKVELTLTDGLISAEMAAMMQQFKPNSTSPQMPRPATKTMAASTDSTGKFRFENIPPGTYWLTAKKPGFGDDRYAPSGSDGSIALTAGQHLTNADFDLTSHATLTGRVLDEDGEPYPSAMVTALSYKFVMGRRRLTPADVAQTNNKGEFSLTKIPPGHYFLSADVVRVGFGVKAPAAPQDGTPGTAYVGTYLPNVVEVGQAQKIDVAV